MSRQKTDLKPTVKKAVTSPRKSMSRFPSVSPRSVSISPRHSIDNVDSVDLKWTVDMVRGYTIPVSKKDNERSQRTGHVQTNKTPEGDRSISKDAEKLQKYLSLQKLINQLREEIKEKNKTIDNLQGQLDKNASEYKQNLKNKDELITKHEKKIGSFYEEIKGFKEAIMEGTREMDVMKKELETTKTECEEKVQNVKTKTDAQITAMSQQHKKELADRDAKLSFLKKQLESALNSNSKERQRQLEDLTKELTRVTDETEVLKAKLRSLAKQKQSDGCRNCTTLEEALHAKLKELREKDGTIVELLQHCQKMAIQLSRTDEFVKLCEQNKLKYG